MSLLRFNKIKQHIHENVQTIQGEKKRVEKHLHASKVFEERRQFFNFWPINTKLNMQN